MTLGLSLRFLEVGRVDVSAETQSGIRRLPFVLICVGGFVRAIPRTKPFGRVFLRWIVWKVLKVF